MDLESQTKEPATEANRRQKGIGEY